MVEKSGVLNLGVEGMMLVGAVAGVRRDRCITGNPLARRSCVAAIAGAMRRCCSLIFAVLTLSLSANQVATGLALTIFGIGFSALAGDPLSGRPIARCRR